MVRYHHIRIPVDDDPSPENNRIMLEALPNVVATIDAQLAIPGRMVVVHCLGGISRSPTVLCAYLMWKYKCRMEDAIQFLRSKRKECFSANMNFQEALEKFRQSE